MASNTPEISAELSPIAPPPSLGDTIYPSQCADPGRTGSAAGRGTPSPSTPGDAGGARVRYRRLHPHARGGLGEVSVALDEELNREVALKQIQGCFADDRENRTRFVREAEITGNLEHPGIVPVYGLLTPPDGRPVYAMRFIKGESLHDTLACFHQADHQPRRDPAERRLALCGLLTRFVAVCHAVAFAHSRGVIHRDLKPANVMLGDFGETLVVDWGLAKILTQGSPEQPTLRKRLRLASPETFPTQFGQVMGTPHFMPPEQARGDVETLDERSDVWALGAMLYAVLTGQPPYQGADVADVLARAASGQVIPARQVKPSVPRPLEAVCHKAMAAVPGERYATAKEVGEEVERWLADERVRADREPWRERVSRWGRRHRTLVTSAVVLLTVSVVGLGVGLAAVNQEKRRTAQQRDQARANFELARQAVDDCFGMAKDDPAFAGDGMRKARKRLLEQTLPFYEGFVAQIADDDDLLEQQAQYLSHVAFITNEIGRKAEALESYEKARDIRVKLSAEHPEEPRHRSFLASTWNNLGLIQSETGQPREALKSYERAKELLSKLSHDRPEEWDYQARLANTLFNLGLLQSETSRLEEALTSYSQARDLQLQLSQAHPEVPGYQADLAATWHNLALLHRRTGQPSEARACYEKATALQLKLTRDHPAVLQHQADLAGTCNDFGNLLRAMGKKEEAWSNYGKAMDLLGKLSQTHPEVTLYQVDLATTWNNLGNLQSETGQPREALRSYERSRDIRHKLCQDHPEVPQYQTSLAGTWHNLGVLHHETEKLPEAQKCYEKARDIRLKLIQAHPETSRYQADLASTHVNLSVLLRDLGKSDEALQPVARAIDLLGIVSRREPGHVGYRGALQNAHRVRADSLGQLGRHGEAVAAWDEVLRLNTNAAAASAIRLQRADALVRSGAPHRAMAEVESLSRMTSLPGGTVYNLACVTALCAAAVTHDDSRPLPERMGQAEVWAEQALVLLHRAAAAGFFRTPANRAHLDKDSDLDFLRDRPDYGEFLATLPASAPASERKP